MSTDEEKQEVWQFRPPSDETRAEAETKIEKVGVRRGGVHFFLCTGPDCCAPDFGLDVWGYLKKRSKELEPELSGGNILRTKASCLRICKGVGPNLVVYPSGRWYYGLNQPNLERVLQYELFGRGTVEDLLLARTGEER